MYSPSAFLLVIIVLLQWNCSLGVVQFGYDDPPENILYADGGTRISGLQEFVDRDIILGGLFTVHTDAAGSAGGKCSTDVWTRGVETLEAMLFAIDSINGDGNLLPDVMLGYDIRDTCQSVNIALEEGLDLLLTKDQTLSVNRTRVSAVIGPLESFVTIPVASLFHLFQMPQVSYASSSTLLSNRDLYGYFFRTFASDNERVEAMIDVLLHYNWLHISTIYSNNLFGTPVIEYFNRLAKDNRICIDLDEGIDDSFQTAEYNILAQKLNNSTANVVVIVAAVDHAKLLLREVSAVYEASTNKRKFLWIAHDATISGFTAEEEFGHLVAGMITPFTLEEYNLDGFDDYLSELNPSSNARNPWFTEYYMTYFNCTDCSNHKESIADQPNYNQFQLVPTVIEAVYSVAHALNNFLEENCETPVQWFPANQTCLGQSMTLNGENLLYYLQNVQFSSPTGKNVSFNEFGSIEAQFNIMNYQTVSDCKTCSQKYQFKSIGIWDENLPVGERLRLAGNITAQFGVNSTGGILYELESQCHICQPGFIKRTIVSSCCGTCDPCLGLNFTNTTSATQCRTCSETMWGNQPLTGSSGCVTVEESYLRPSDAWSIVLIIVAVFGLFAVAFVTAVFAYFWNTPIVKSSGRDMMVIILIGILLCFLITPVYLIKPSPAICALQTIGLWFCITIVLSPLLVKLIRITRIFLIQDISTRPKFVTPAYQILFTFLLLGFQLVLVAISLIVVYPDAERRIVANETNTNDFPTLVVRCTEDHVALLALKMLYCSAILITSNGLAIFTIRFPENFNESKHVAFATFALGLIWIAFVFSYLNTQDKFQTALISFCIQMSGLAVLLCLFGPRVFIMLVWPKQNVQNYVTKPTTGESSTEL